MKIVRITSPFFVLLTLFLTFALGIFRASADDVDPLQLNFHRESVRRFIFSQAIPLGKLVPSEIVALDAMHPLLPTPGAGAPCEYKIVNGMLSVGSTSQKSDSAIYVSGVNPFGTYRMDIRSMSPGAEAGIEFATVDRGTRVDVVVADSSTNFVTLRLIKQGQVARELPLFTGPPISAPFTLLVQLAGTSLEAFALKDGNTIYLGHTDSKHGFGDIIDFRTRAVMNSTTFNIATDLPQDGNVVLNGAEAELSSGMGQADIRAVTHADGSPYIENNRLWFTFSCRGIGTGEAYQGVMSIDPSVFDPRMEGVIVFDRGDGLLRNDYASDLFYDDDAKEWRAITCCFSANVGGRGPTGLALAHSAHDPRRGFSVMSEKLLDADHLPLRHEDPCLIHDVAASKWRLLTSCFENKGIWAELFEADQWDGPYTKIAGPVQYNSTGTLIQKIGSKRYVLSGTEKGPAGKGGVLLYSYPELNFLGEMKYDLPATMRGGRIWPGILPLPPGYPARYMALTMDRANFPDIQGGNWSYGALYLFWADTPQIDSPYEYNLPK